MKKSHTFSMEKIYHFMCENVRIGGVMQLTWYIDMATI